MNETTQNEPTLSPDDERDLLAAEISLGLLSEAEHDAAMRRAAMEPDLARRIASWGRRLQPLMAAAPEEPARAGLLRSIERRLGEGLPTSTVVREAEERAEMRRVAKARKASARRERQAQRQAQRQASRASGPVSRGVWSSAGFWRTAFGGAVAACGVLLAVIVTERDLRPLYEPTLAPLVERVGWRLPARNEPLVAALAPADGDHVYLLSLEGGEVSARTLAYDEEARVPELWLVPEEGGPTRSLGLLPPPGEPARFALPENELANLREGATLAVSLEPPGGAPGGVATGPVVALGTLLKP